MTYVTLFWFPDISKRPCFTSKNIIIKEYRCLFLINEAIRSDNLVICCMIISSYFFCTNHIKVLSKDDIDSDDDLNRGKKKQE